MKGLTGGVLLKGSSGVLVGIDIGFYIETIFDKKLVRARCKIRSC